MNNEIDIFDGNQRQFDWDMHWFETACVLKYICIEIAIKLRFTVQVNKAFRFVCLNCGYNLCEDCECNSV